MNHELRSILSQQTEGWPRWQSAFNADDQVDDKLHLFVFNPIASTWSGRFGRPLAVCQFVNGAASVKAFPWLPGSDPSDAPLCSHCVGVDLELLLA